MEMALRGETYETPLLRLLMEHGADLTATNVSKKLFNLTPAI
jgi:hypothetical protein